MLINLTKSKVNLFSKTSTKPHVKKKIRFGTILLLLVLLSFYTLLAYLISGRNFPSSDLYDIHIFFLTISFSFGLAAGFGLIVYLISAGFAIIRNALRNNSNNEGSNRIPKYDLQKVLQFTTPIIGLILSLYSFIYVGEYIFSDNELLGEFFNLMSLIHFLILPVFTFGGFIAAVISNRINHHFLGRSVIIISIFSILMMICLTISQIIYAIYWVEYPALLNT